MLIKIIRFVFLTIICFAIVFSLHWQGLAPNEKQMLSQRLDSMLRSGSFSVGANGFMQVDMGESESIKNKLQQSKALLPAQAITGVNSEQSTQAPKPLTQAVEQQVDEQFEQLARLNAEYWQESSVPEACRRVKSQAIEATSTQSIYSWRDKNGKMHFSDINPQQQTGSSREGNKQAVTVREYEKEQDLFNLSIVKGHPDIQLMSVNRMRRDIKAIYTLLADGLGFSDLRKVDLSLRLFSDQKAFQRYKNKVAPGSKTNTGFYTSRLNEASVVQWERRPELTYGVIRHESSHVIMAALFGSTPRWFNEGLAEYVELLSTGGQYRHIALDKDKIVFLRQQLDAQQLPSIEFLWGLEAKAFYQNTRLHYSMAWSLIHFMLNDDNEKQVFLSLIKELYNKPCQKPDMLALVEGVYPGGMQAFERAYVMSLKTNSLKDHYY